jgi:AraC-like DNA-binding protein
LPICVYDEPGGKQRLLKRRRAAEMARLFTMESKTVKELAQIFGVSKRTVQRALKSAFGDNRKENHEVVIASSDLSERGNLGEGSSPPP